MDCFITRGNELYCECFPLNSKLIGKRQEHNPWMTLHLKKNTWSKSDSFHLMKLNIISREENKLFHDRVNALLKKRKITYYENLFLCFRQNVKKNWELIKKLNNCKTSVSTRKILYNIVIYSDSSDNKSCSIFILLT